LAWRQAGSILSDVIRDLLHKYGPFAALLILAVLWYESRMTRLWNARLKDKDKEIERVVSDRNKLQEVILRERISSMESEKKDNNA